MRKRISHCAVSTCSTKYDGRIGFYRFPKGDRKRCIEWLVICGRVELVDKETDFFYSHLRVCGKHFEEKMFLNMHKNRLLPAARPTLHLPDLGCLAHVITVETDNEDAFNDVDTFDQDQDTNLEHLELMIPDNEITRSSSPLSIPKHHMHLVRAPRPQKRRPATTKRSKVDSLPKK